jgi:hypothetical protein
MNDWQAAVAAIPVKLGCDRHRERCDLAKADGPDATLACAKCDRARWLHKTRADTCGQFCWVTQDSLTTDQIERLRLIPGVPEMIRLACARALNEFGLAPYYVKEARLTCVAAINNAKRASVDVVGEKQTTR